MFIILVCGSMTSSTLSETGLCVGPSSCLLPDLPSGLLEAVVALFVGAPRAEAKADDGWPRPPLEKKDREDDAEAEAQGGFYQEVGKASIPLRAKHPDFVSVCLLLPPLTTHSRLDRGKQEPWSIVDRRTFSFKSASLTGRETVLGGGGGTEVSAIVTVDVGMCL